MAEGGEAKTSLPSWLLVGRAIASTGVGLFVILAQTLGNGPSNVLLLVAALLLVGVAPADLWGFIRGRGGE